MNGADFIEYIKRIDIDGEVELSLCRPSPEPARIFKIKRIK